MDADEAMQHAWDDLTGDEQARYRTEVPPRKNPWGSMTITDILDTDVPRRPRTTTPPRTVHYRAPEDRPPHTGIFSAVRDGTVTLTEAQKKVLLGAYILGARTIVRGSMTVLRALEHRGITRAPAKRPGEIGRAELTEEGTQLMYWLRERSGVKA